MKVSLKWLNNYVDCKEFFETPDKLSEILTAAGLEVEGLENYGQQFAKVVVGHIKVLGRHPDADRLTLCQVDIGSGEDQQIICGAKNHKEGDKVVVATPGAVLPGDFAIKKSKIRGVESNGMLCSQTELGLGDEGSGIIILPADAPVGEAFADYYGLDDIIFELSVTPNRADCLSHFGLARELSALLDRPLNSPETDVKTSGGKTTELVNVELKNSDWCPRYAGRAIRGVQVKESPAWLKQAIESVGINSINNIVDVTNYVLMELGQPLHAFDVKYLEGGKVIIKNSDKDESFQTLDGTKIKLTGEELTIRDEKKAVALAGVVGGLNSGVVDSTTDVFIESAYFSSGPNRRASRRFGIQTDSCYRFSRGTDPDGVVFAMNRACHLIQKVAGGDVAPDHIDEYPNAIQREPIVISKSYLEDRLGYRVEFEDFANWMKRLGCQVEAGSDAEQLKVLAPAFRWDLFYDVDLVEEYARLHGYDKIPETLPSFSYEPLQQDEEYLNEKSLAELMSGEGYMQAVNYGFISESYEAGLWGSFGNEKSWGLRAIEKAVTLQNPLSEDLNVMRRALLPGLVKNLVHNYRYGNEYGRLFELGHVFYAQDGAEKDKNQYGQDLHLSGIAWGQRSLLWQKDEKRPVVYDLKSSLENLLNNLQVKSYQWRDLPENETPKFLHPGQCAYLFVEGRSVGIIGSLHPSILETNKIRTDVAVFEWDVQKLMRGQPRVAKAAALSKFPSVERDFAFVLDDSHKVGDVIQQIKKAGGKYLRNVDIFDRFESEKLGAGKCSVGFRLTYQDDEGTLGDEQLTKMQNDIIAKVSQKLGLEIR